MSSAQLYGVEPDYRLAHPASHPPHSVSENSFSVSPSRNNDYRNKLSPTKLDSPLSSRRSLDESSEISSDATLHSTESNSGNNLLKSPSTPPPSSNLTDDHTPGFEHIRHSVEQVLSGEKNKCSIDNIPVNLWENFDAWANGNLPGWEGLRSDYIDGQLSVFSPSIGHEIAQDIFRESFQSRNLGEPYNGITLMLGGQAGVYLSRNRKEPDFSVYEHIPGSKQQSNVPTVAWETAYSESEEKLTLDAARLLCLSQGQVQLVIALNLTHTRDKCQARQLKGVEWAHWEVIKIDPAEPGSQCSLPTIDELDHLGVPVSYTAVVDYGEGTKEKITAGKVESFQIFPQLPGAQDRAVELRYRHFYRDCNLEDEEKAYMSFRFPDILAAVLKHELHQIAADEDAAMARQGRKRKDGPGGLDDVIHNVDKKRQRLSLRPLSLARRIPGSDN